MAESARTGPRLSLFEDVLDAVEVAVDDGELLLVVVLHRPRLQKRAVVDQRLSPGSDAKTKRRKRKRALPHLAQRLAKAATRSTNYLETAGIAVSRRYRLK